MNFNKALILAGGKGTRFEEQTQDIPKPMILAKNDPLLIHVMSIYIKHKINDFTILAGYKKEIITQYFQKNAKTISKLDAKYEMNNGSLVTVLDTGDETLTGGRIKIGLDYVDEDNVYIENSNLVGVGYFHSGKSGLAQSGDGDDFGDLWWLANKSLIIWINKNLKKGEKILNKYK